MTGHDISTLNVSVDIFTIKPPESRSRTQFHLTFSGVKILVHSEVRPTKLTNCPHTPQRRLKHRVPEFCSFSGFPRSFSEFPRSFSEFLRSFSGFVRGFPDSCAVFPNPCAVFPDSSAILRTHEQTIERGSGDNGGNEQDKQTKSETADRRKAEPS